MWKEGMRLLVGLHQRELRRRHGPRQGVHRDARASALELRQVLADGLGAAVAGHRHDDQSGGGGTGIVHVIVLCISIRISDPEPFTNFEY